MNLPSVHLSGNGSDARVAFIGIGQGYPSHVWMRRMRGLLSKEIAVSIDDGRNTRKVPQEDSGLRLVPRKLGRMKRVLGRLKLTEETSESLRTEWLKREIDNSRATHVLVHFLNYATEFNEVWRNIEIPVLIHCHGYDISFDVRDYQTGQPYHDSSYLDRVRSLPKNVFFLANSTSTKSKLLDIGINADKIAIKRFGVDVSNDPPNIGMETSRNIVFLGRLVDFKGPVETVKAFAPITAKHPDVTLDIAGDGYLAVDIDEAADRLGISNRIRRHGVVNTEQGKTLREHAAIFTAHSQVGPLSGQEEAFGVSFLEAMAQGVPVVTGHSGGLPDFVQHDANGMLFSPGDVKTHTEYLDQLLSDEKRRRKLGLAAWETVRDRYQPKHEYEDLINAFALASESINTPVLAASAKAA